MDTLSPAAFAQSLAQLKAGRAPILVCGRESLHHEPVCTRLLSKEKGNIRVKATGDPARMQGPDASTIHYRSYYRSASARPSPDNNTPETPQELLTAVCRHIDQEQALGQDQVEVCFQDIEPLLMDHGTELIGTLLDDIASYAKPVRVHGHLEMNPARSSVDALTPPFRCVLEPDQRDGNPRYRWRFPERGATSAWLEVP